MEEQLPEDKETGVGGRARRWGDHTLAVQVSLDDPQVTPDVTPPRPHPSCR